MNRFLSATLAVLFAFSLAAPAQAGKYNSKVSIGDAAPVFSNLPGTDGKKHSLADFKNKDFVVIAITCNHCPVAADYEDRIIAFAKKYASKDDSKVAVVAISVSILEEDTLDKMKERAKTKGFNFPYLSDQSQNLGRSLGAIVTPEFFVLDKNRKIVYMGAMDDDQTVEDVKKKYLEAAVDALLAGTKITTTETRAVGCALKYNKK